MSAPRLARAWAEQLEEWRPQRPTPEQWRQAWRATMADWPVSNEGPRPMWLPDQDARDHSGLARAMRAAGFPAAQIDAFYQWSIDEPAAFWQAMVTTLGIQFVTPPAATLDMPDGVERPRWLPGARLNIAASCFAAEPDATAIIQSAEDGTLTRTSYRDLKAQVNRIVRALRADGLRPGDAVAVIMPMTADAVAIFLGIIAAGGAVVSIADSFAAPEIAKRLRISGASAIFCGGTTERAGKTIDIYARVREIDGPVTIVVGGQNAPRRPDDVSFETFLERSATSRGRRQ